MVNALLESGGWTKCLLFWKCSSPCGVRFFCLDGVAGDPSSWSRQKLAWRSCPEREGINLGFFVSPWRSSDEDGGGGEARRDVPVTVDSLPLPRGTSSRGAIAMRAGDFASQRAVEGICVEATMPGQFAAGAHPAVALAGSRAGFESGSVGLGRRRRGPGWGESAGGGGFYRSLQGRREFGSHRALAVESHSFAGCRGVQQESGPGKEWGFW